jgi:hypothetical protein
VVFSPHRLERVSLRVSLAGCVHRVIFCASAQRTWLPCTPSNIRRISFHIFSTHFASILAPFPFTTRGACTLRPHVCVFVPLGQFRPLGGVRRFHSIGGVHLSRLECSMLRPPRARLLRARLYLALRSLVFRVAGWMNGITICGYTCIFCADASMFHSRATIDRASLPARARAPSYLVFLLPRSSLPRLHALPPFFGLYYRRGLVVLCAPVLHEHFMRSLDTPHFAISFAIAIHLALTIYFPTSVLCWAASSSATTYIPAR